MTRKGMVSFDFGRELRFVGEVTLTGSRVGADRKFWSKLQEDAELFRRVIDFAMNGGYELPTRFKVRVDHSLTAEELHDRGAYVDDPGLLDSAELRDIQTSGEGCEEVEIELVHDVVPENGLYARQLLAENPLDEGRRFATTYELLSLGWQHPLLQLGQTIVTPCELAGKPGFLTLRSYSYEGGGLGRGLTFIHTNGGPLVDECRIATVRL